jgi:hypothetical protein
VWKLTNGNVWPRQGGLDDQDWSVVQDIITCAGLDARLEWEHENQGSESDELESQHLGKSVNVEDL